MRRSGPARLAEPLDTGLDRGQALGCGGMQHLGLLVKVGRSLDAEVPAGQPAGDKLEGAQQLLEGQGLERTVNAAQLRVEVQPGRA